jgi:hypothetical protein
MKCVTPFHFSEKSVKVKRVQKVFFIKSQNLKKINKQIPDSILP